MVAARNRREAIVPLLTAINGLDDPQAKKDILMAQSKTGNNALMLAAIHRFSSIGMLLDTIDRTFEPDSDEPSEDYDSLLEHERITKGKLFGGIKTLTEERRIELFKKCLDPTTSLGRKMWKASGINYCSLGTGTLKKIVDELQTLEPGFDPSTGLSSSTESQEEVKDVPLNDESEPEQAGVELREDVKTSIYNIQLALQEHLNTHDATHVIALFAALQHLDEHNDKAHDILKGCLDYFEIDDNDKLSPAEAQSQKEAKLNELSTMIYDATDTAASGASVSQQGIFTPEPMQAVKIAFEGFKSKEECLMQDDKKRPK